MTPLIPSALVLLAATALGIAGQDDDEALARALLEHGQERASKGQYDQALSTYRKAAKKYPETEAGRVAERRTRPNALLGWSDIERSGPSDNRVDVVVMGDGYTLGHLATSFDSRSEDVLDAFDREPVLREYFSYFNFIRAAVVSADDGIDGYGREADTALGSYLTSRASTSYGAVRTGDVLEYLNQLPEQDGVAVAMIKNQSLGAPSGPVATVGGAKRDLDAIVHAWGHAFAGLGDEFSDPDGHPFPPGRRPNVSNSETDVPWQHFLDERIAGVGVYEGASGQVRDVWRPVAGNCVMNRARRYCPVCREAVVLAIYALVDGIESATPEPQELGSEEELVAELEPTSESRHRSFEFEVRTMRPASHSLEVAWWVVPEHRAPRSKGVRVPHAERVARGPLPPIEAEPVREQRTSKSGRFEFEVDPDDLEPGRYRVICRARDRTEVPGDREPWVLADPRGLLEAERAWWIRVPER